MKSAFKRATSVVRRRPRAAEAGNEGVGQEGDEENGAKKKKKKRFRFSLGGLRAGTCSTLQCHLVS
jgi:hypothetical protein